MALFPKFLKQGIMYWSKNTSSFLSFSFFLFFPSLVFRLFSPKHSSSSSSSSSSFHSGTITAIPYINILGSKTGDLDRKT
jgi:hypothetical protein